MTDFVYVKKLLWVAGFVLVSLLSFYVLTHTVLQLMDSEGQYCAMETIYGSDGVVEEDTGRGMSDRVQSVATTVYRELERMIPVYGEEVVKEIMPHVVTILESLDAAYKENEERVCYDSQVLDCDKRF
jgi:hypothetical protein